MNGGCCGPCSICTSGIGSSWPMRSTTASLSNWPGRCTSSSRSSTCATRDPDAAQEIFDEAIRLLRDAMVETRRLIGGLRPPILDESGIVDGINYLISEQSQHGGANIEFIHPTEFGRLAPSLESTIFRIVQEGLTNAAGTVKSEKVRVELGQTGDRVHVEVRDWGIGFRSGASRTSPFRPSKGFASGPG